jgi:hypothetical protein
MQDLRNKSQLQTQKANSPGSTDKLVVKKCSCGTPMYIHIKGENVIFTGCEPCLTNLRFVKSSNEEVLIRADRSTKRTRCTCKRTHLLSTFEEVKDELSKT